jgi:hypothetical protein
MTHILIVSPFSKSPASSSEPSTRDSNSSSNGSSSNGSKTDLTDAWAAAVAEMSAKHDGEDSKDSSGQTSLAESSKDAVARELV